MVTETEAPAIFSMDRRYRYLVRRRVALAKGICLWIMLNPSSANETENDPTVRRCITFARDWGFGTMEVVNLYALVSTVPPKLWKESDPVGPENDRHILEAAQKADRVMLGWGNHGVGRARAVVEMLQQAGIPMGYLELTQEGQPRHPLYVRKNRVPTIVKQWPWSLEL